MKKHLCGIFLLMGVHALAADEAPVPDQGFAGDRYATLWKKSPFAIATPDTPAASADYQFIALAQLEGVTYVTLIDKQSQEHFVLTSEKPVRNLTLVSTSHGAQGTSAVLEHNGERLTLQLEQGAPPPAMLPGMSVVGAPPAGIPMTSPHPIMGMVPATPPPVRFHHRVARIPLPPPPSPSQ